MAKSLLFIPDISGFTNFVQTTEAEHSQHVIAELLEVLIKANTQDLKLAEVEGDALFFYKEGQIPSQEKILAQIESMYTAFYSHLRMMETNRICPCNACATAPNLELKIVLHCGEMQFLTVQGNRKPFGEIVIQAHRLLKNSIKSDNYVLISNALAQEIKLASDYESLLFQFQKGVDLYDGKPIDYLFANIDVTQLKLHNFDAPILYKPDLPPDFTKAVKIGKSAYEVYEMITNYRHRHKWVKGVDEFKYDANEVTRTGTEHTCVINGRHFDFTTVIKEVPAHQLVYGELTFNPPPVERLYQFYILDPISETSCELTVEVYWRTKTPLQKLLMLIGAKKQMTSGLSASIDNLVDLMRQKEPLAEELDGQ
ncbi:DUF2652 domain-containing protein [Allomuricauda sp. d1]|uniref:DUF2652 domain-containing protein n=1 Tax=Allomuricauda sp. d1 TaxID=3136725 RepID=UPI0031D34A19